MSFKNHLTKGILFLGMLIFSTSFHNNIQAQINGEALFKSKCASCHNPITKLTGPALKGVDTRVPSKEWLYKWVHNSAALIASGDKYANQIYSDNGKVPMTAFPELKNEEIDAIVSYVNAYQPKSASTPAGNATGDSSEGNANNNWLYAIFTISLAIIALALISVNKVLKNNTANIQGLPMVKDLPFYKHKAWIALMAVILFVLLGYSLSNYLIGLGRMQNYQPKQPIFYSHKVHAGVNQINCLYCHSSAEKSKMAMVPSTNVCMNCHAAINEYKGEQLFDAEGHKVNGTMEIQKLYNYAGWNAEKGDYNRDVNGNILAKKIEWVRIHNLPEHVYFNHSQHVKVGEVQCQSCHGDIQNMDEVYQFSDLSMGFCVNCHRNTKVKFDEKSGYYHNIYKQYAQDLKDQTKDSITVEMIGGTDCQRCHY